MDSQLRVVFKDRSDAGTKLAAAVLQTAPAPDSLVLALPRGGVPVASEVALSLHAELDIFSVRKLGLPDQEELAVGAIASGGIRVLNEPLIRSLRLAPELIDAIALYEQKELNRREAIYREGRPALPVRGRNLVLVDDGLATGSTMKAAIRALRLHEPRQITVAVPVAAPQTCHELAAETDMLVCLITPESFYAVGNWYERFPQVTDAEVKRLLAAAQTRVSLRNA